MKPFYVFAVLTLVAYRLQRVVTADKWPPTQWFRDKLEDRFGDESNTYLFFTCPWCFGFWVTIAIFLNAALFVSISYPFAQAIAASAIVGKLGSGD